MALFYKESMALSSAWGRGKRQSVVRGGVYRQPDNALSRRSGPVCLSLWQDNGSVTRRQDSPSLTIQLGVPVHIHCLLTDCQRCHGCPFNPTVTVSGGADWGDCQRLVTKHLPADRFAIKARGMSLLRGRKTETVGRRRGGARAEMEQSR